MTSIYESKDSLQSGYKRWPFEAFNHRCIPNCVFLNGKTYFDNFYVSKKLSKSITDAFKEADLENNWLFDTTNNVFYFKTKEDMLFFKLRFHDEL